MMKSNTSKIFLSMWFGITIVYFAVKLDFNSSYESLGRVVLFFYFCRFVALFIAGKIMYIPRVSKPLKKNEDDAYRYILFALGCVFCLGLLLE